MGVVVGGVSGVGVEGVVVGWDGWIWRGVGGGRVCGRDGQDRVIR